MFSTQAVTSHSSWRSTALSGLQVQFVQGGYRLRSPFRDLDDDAFRAQSLYGSTLLVLALASPAARPRLLERLKTIERRLRRRPWPGGSPGKTTRKRPRAA